MLWVASQPRAELDPWLTLLQEMGATPVFITPWQRALLEAVHEPHPSALYLTLETGLARLFFARGLNLRFTRDFPLPESLDPHQPAETGALELSRVIHEELSLILQFIQQKHRGAAPTALFTVGLPASPSPFLDSVRLDLGLTITNLATDLPTFLADGADRERERKDRLDLLPEEIRQARRLATYKILVRTGAAVMLLLCGATAALVRHQVKSWSRRPSRPRSASNKGSPWPGRARLHPVCASACCGCARPRTASGAPSSIWNSSAYAFCRPLLG